MNKIIGGQFEQNAANIMIDLVDAFQNAQDGDARWEVANKAADSIGAKSLLIGAFQENELLPAWSRARIDEDWGADYHENGFYEADLVLLNRQRGNLSATHRSGTTAAEQGISLKSVDWCHGLRDAGYGGHIIRTFAGSTGLTQTLVSFLPSTEDGEDAFRINDALITGVAALVSAYIGPPNANDNGGNLNCGYQELSTREREVISLLAEGLNTGRIAEKLGLAEVTVHKHFKGARVKMRATNREQTLALAMVRNQIYL